jgi:hypothetical protein
LGFWTTVVMVALSAYAAAYLCTVRRPVSFLGRGSGPWEVRPIYGNGDAQGFYRALFGPAHWMDKRIRRDEWLIE